MTSFAMSSPKPSFLVSPKDISLKTAIFWLLRIGAGLNFIGHGTWGVLTKEAWLPFFSVANIGPDVAYRFMPLIGLSDIMFGLLVIFRPMRSVIFCIAFWSAWTALLRPLAGQGWREEYNRYRPHSSLGYQTPEEFANSIVRPLDIPDNAEVGPKTLTLSGT